MAAPFSRCHVRGLPPPHTPHPIRDKLWGLVVLSQFSGKKFDLIICTYFTAGNFRPDEIKNEIDKNGHIKPYSKKLFDPNKNFIRVFKPVYEMLTANGRIFLGSIYIDTDNNRKQQEEFYKKCRMNIITSKDDEFTATKEGFWSERFTRDKIYKYFYWVNKRSIKFVPLDNYNFAESIIISRR